MNHVKQAPKGKVLTFYDAWWFLAEHPIYRVSEKKGVWHDSIFPYNGTLDIHVAKVDPVTRKIEDDHSRNTAVEVWLESGPWHKTSEMVGWEKEEYEKLSPPGSSSHDYRLDCGAATFEEAIIELAKLVRRYYNDDGTEKKKKPRL